MSFSITITGVSETNKYLRNKNISIKRGISNSMKEVEKILINEVEASISGRKDEQMSVDTGRFLRSVQGKVSNESVVVYSDVEYAQFLEYGTSKVSERRHFRNSIERTKGEIQKIIKKNIQRMI